MLVDDLHVPAAVIPVATDTIFPDVDLARGIGNFINLIHTRPEIDYSLSISFKSLPCLSFQAVKPLALPP